MRKGLIILAIILWLTFPLSAEAVGLGPENVNTNTALGGNASANATGIGVGVGIAGAKSDATAINVNSNFISTRQDLSVRNSNSQFQIQGQGQKQSIDAPLTNTTDISIVNPEPKRDLPVFPTYQAPGMIEYRGPYDKGIQSKATPWKLKKAWTKEEASGFYSSMDSASCKVYPIQKKAATERISVDTPKDTPVACILECVAESGFELWGTAANEAFACGGTYIEEVAYKITYKNKASGWNIGIGGGVSVVGAGNDDRFGGSMGGGTGFGSVTTEPIEKASAIFYVY